MFNRTAADNIVVMIGMRKLGVIADAISTAFNVIWAYRCM